MLVLFLLCLLACAGSGRQNSGSTAGEIPYVRDKQVSTWFSCSLVMLIFCLCIYTNHHVSSYRYILYSLLFL